MAVLYTPHFIQFFDDDGDPLSGGKLYTYEAGTSTPKATYTTAAGSVSNANPVVLDSAGRATVFLDGSYKFALFTSSDVAVEETDNVTAFSAGAGGVDFSTLDTAAPALDDNLLFSDTSDANANKKSTIAGVIGLVPCNESGLILTPANTDYKIVVKAACGGTITQTTTICDSGTCTATFKINSTALGGTANSVSSAEQSQAHASNNTFVAGDDIVITISANSSCIKMSYNIHYTKTLS